MVIQSQQNGEKIARALNRHLPAVWRERPHSHSQGSSDIIQDYWQIYIAAPWIACTRPSYTIWAHMPPCPAATGSPNWGVSEGPAGGLKEETRVNDAKISVKKTYQGTYSRPKDLVLALAQDQTLHQTAIRRYLFTVLTSTGKQSDMLVWFIRPSNLSVTSKNNTLEQGLFGFLAKPLVFLIDNSSFTTVNTLKKKSIFIWTVHISVKANNIIMVSVQWKCGNVSPLSLYSQGYRGKKKITLHQM